MTTETQNNGLLRASKDNICPHCGKPDWCYFIGELSCCKRGNDPATGWEKTGKTDKEGTPYYAPVREKKAIRPKGKRIWEYPDRSNSRLARTVRIDDGNGKRNVWQEHWDRDKKKWVKGLGEIKREDIPIYRLEDLHEYIQHGETIYITEGEPCADALWALGLPATTNIGGSKKWRQSDFEDLQHAAEVVICPDRDKPGLEHALTIAEYFPNAKWLIPYPDSPVWQSLPDSGGLDIADWISDFQVTKREELEILIKEELPLFSRLRGGEELKETIDSSKPYHDGRDGEQAAEENFTQKAYIALYSDSRWISFGGNLYQWDGQHYKPRSESEEKRRIQGWLNTYVEWVRGVPRYSRANSRSVEEVWKWVVASCGIDVNQINPPGLNCKNGVLRILWEANEQGVLEAKPCLSPHSPEELYTYVSEVVYDPTADATHCDRLLECLDPPQRKIFLQTIAAALDLKTIRRCCGRMTRLLLLWGEGANGKDTLRESVAAVFGTGLTGASLTDFQSYDQGRKFSLAKLEGSLINWASENTKFAALDSLQSIKQFATGDPISIERKGRDEYEVNPRAVGLFNCNEPPLIKGGMEAVTSRWAVLRFNKVFKRDADPAKGELEADPRFKYDSDFLRQEVAPALLNKLLEELRTLIADGIDYSGAKDGFRDIQEETCHLWTFCREAGIEQQPGSRIYVKDLWEELKNFYLSDGTLEIDENGKQVWNDPPRKGDRPVKAPNQIRARFCELFPKTGYARETTDKSRCGMYFISGLAKIASTASVDRPVRLTASATASTASATASITEAVEKTASTASVDRPVRLTASANPRFTEAVAEATTLTLQGTEAVEAIFPQLLQLLSKLSDEKRSELSVALEKAQQFNERVAGLTELLRDAVSERLDYQVVKSLAADITQDEREAVWQNLSETERQYLSCAKAAADFAPGTKVKDRADGRLGTVASVAIRFSPGTKKLPESFVTKAFVDWGDGGRLENLAVEILERVED